MKNSFNEKWKLIRIDINGKFCKQITIISKFYFTLIRTDTKCSQFGKTKFSYNQRLGFNWVEKWALGISAQPWSKPRRSRFWGRRRFRPWRRSGACNWFQPPPASLPSPHSRKPRRRAPACCAPPPRISRFRRSPAHWHCRSGASRRRLGHARRRWRAQLREVRERRGGCGEIWGPWFYFLCFEFWLWVGDTCIYSWITFPFIELFGLEI